MDKLRAFEAFVTVADHSSFTGAARRLGASRAQVSKQVQALEDHLGIRLLHRTTRKVSLTDEGRAFRERARLILEEVRDAEAALSELSGGARGTLRLGAPMSFGVRYLAPAVADFMARHPSLAVEMVCSDRKVDIVEEGYDVAVRIGQLEDSSLVARRLGPVKAYASASPDYLAAWGTPATPDDLKEHRCLRYSLLSSPFWTFRKGDESRPIRTDGPLIANNGDILVQAAVRGLGIIVNPDFIVADQLRSGELVPILEDWEIDGPRAVWAMYPHRRHLSAKVRLLVDFLVERFSPEPPWSCDGC